jgi:putative spermidine/putrescine transport system ATP-binding protein
MAFLQLANITKQFGQTLAVEQFNLDVAKGEFVTFLGPSGCGKTTVLRMIAGFERPSSGTITVNDRDLTNTPPNRRNVGMVFQNYALFPNMSVADNVGFGLMVQGKRKDEQQDRVHEVLRLVQLGAFAKRYPYQLSGGQQQRVALARALAFRPELLLLDEPLSALDAKVRGELRQEIRRIQQELGITAIFVTHDQEEAMSISDRIVVMNKGRVEQVAAPFEVYNYPSTAFVASFVGTLNRLPCKVEDAATGTVRYNGSLLRTSHKVEQPNGTEATLMVRPEEIRLGEKEGANHLTGTVQSVSFLGATVRVNVALSEGVVTCDLFNERQLQLPKVNESHTVMFPPHACWVM